MEHRWEKKADLPDWRLREEVLKQRQRPKQLQPGGRLESGIVANSDDLQATSERRKLETPLQGAKTSQLSDLLQRFQPKIDPPKSTATSNHNRNSRVARQSATTEAVSSRSDQSQARSEKNQKNSSLMTKSSELQHRSELNSKNKLPSQLEAVSIQVAANNQSQKKSLTSFQEQTSDHSFERSDRAHNQVEQGNSYLYAYNDFISPRSPQAPTREEVILNKGGFRKEEPSVQNKVRAIVDERIVINNLATVGHNHGHQLATEANSHHKKHYHHHNHHRHLKGNQIEETLIDSEEDDALSYILHQHQRASEYLEQSSQVANLNPPNLQLFQVDQFVGDCSPHTAATSESIHSFENHTIDHHLSCSRSLHPRHICGIGSYANNTASIAGRLKEESLRAFKLNQRPPNERQSLNSSRIASPGANFIGQIVEQHHKRPSSFVQFHPQASQLTLNSNRNHSQLATSSEFLTTQPIDEREEYTSDERVYLDSSRNLNNPIAANQLVGSQVIQCIHTTSANPHQQTYSETETNCESSSVSSGLDQSKPFSKSKDPQRAAARSQSQSAGYISWLVCTICNLFSYSQTSASVSHLESNKSARTSPKRLRSSTSAASAAQGGGSKAIATSSRNANDPSNSRLKMYSTANTQQGDIPGQAPVGHPGTYYHASPNEHHHQFHPHYFMSSDSSLTSSNAFTNSAERLSSFFKGCCSKKCLFVTCMMLILFIIVVVTGLSAYLNMLISVHKTHLVPLSGRLKIETQGDSFTDQLANRTSKEFLVKQQQYETILRGAFDRAQNLLKTYPNHLVKCEVYTFKPGSLWVYFRLFINKKSLMQDGHLMKRKSPDEHVDRQFLPRLTQQTLHSGFEELLLSSSDKSAAATAATASDRRTRSSALQSSDLRRSRNGQHSTIETANAKSFDEQITRLMPIIESIDLQTIQVSPDFDMLQQNQPQPIQSMSDKLRAQFLTTTASSPASGGGVSSSPSKAEYDVLQPETNQSSYGITKEATRLDGPTLKQKDNLTTEFTVTTASSGDDVNVSTKKFTLYGYRENTTRPSTSPRPLVFSSTGSMSNQDENPFLKNQQRKPSTTSAPAVSTSLSASVRQSQTVREITTQIRESSTQASVNSDPEDKIIKLVSGQPIFSQSGHRPQSKALAEHVSEKSVENRTLLGHQDSMSTVSTGTSTSQPDMGRNSNSGKIDVIPTTLTLDPNRIENTRNSSMNPSRVNVQSTTSSIQELWRDVFREGHNNSDTTNALINNRTDSHIGRHIIAATANGDRDLRTNQGVRVSSTTPNDWQTISILSPEIPNTIRAALNTTAQSVVAANKFGLVSTQLGTVKPKVAPAMRHGGSIISIPLRPGGETSSAIILNRDFVTNSTPSNVTSTSSEIPPTNIQAARQQKRKPIVDKRKTISIGGGNSTSTDNVRANNRTAKPIIKQVKPITSNKKASEIHGSIGNGTNGTVINSKKIQVSEKLMTNSASNEAIPDVRLNQTFSIQNAQDRSTSDKNQQKLQATRVGGKPKATEDIFVPTLASTVDLTRSTGALPSPSSTTQATQVGSLNQHNAGHRTAESDSTTPSIGLSELARKHQTDQLSVSTSTETPTTRARDRLMQPSAGSVLTNHAPATDLQLEPPNPFASGQSVRPGTTSFSNQWLPIQHHGPAPASELSLTSILPMDRHNMSLIVNTERLPSFSNPPPNQGSQSPFAMPASLFQSQPTRGIAGARSGPRRNGATVDTNMMTGNAFQVSNIMGNEFESHRVSRMHHTDRQSSFSSTSTTSSQGSSSTTTSSIPLSIGSDSEDISLIDTILVPPMKVDSIVTSSTILPPLMSQNHNHLPDISTTSLLSPINPIDMHPRKTRGPFAFETIKSFAFPDVGSIEAGESSGANPFSTRSGRSLINDGTNHRVLVRKQLLTDTQDERDGETLSSSPSTAVVSDTRQTLRDSTTATFPESEYGPAELLTGHDVSRFGSRQAPSTSDIPSRQCQYYGCRAKNNSHKHICLNQTQICDDFIDCHDESDELDCVSLLKYDSMSDRLSFSNGEGFIYLNRKGSLAPMCVGNYADNDNSAPSLKDKQEQARRQQELIKQVNTIAQYACSLQSFSKLVSVKINHHNLVDGLDQMKSSKLFHTLAITAGANPSQNNLSHHDTYKSGSSEYEVEVSSSPACSSERTVFVKCGGFECGQDSFTVMDNNRLVTGKKEGVIINDFPWLVKLYYQKSLACHGYLIDELWLLSSKECLAGKGSSRVNESAYEWTAEISYEHWGNDDYQSIESNRRSIEAIYIPDQKNGLNANMGANIALAKLEKPVRFSPLNRPICLPQEPEGQYGQEASGSKDCITATLDSTSSGPLNQGLYLSKVKLSKVSDCLYGQEKNLSGDHICASDRSISENGQARPSTNSSRVLICSTSQASRNRSKWTVVGIQRDVPEIQLKAGHRLFAAVGSSLSWIVDIMNPQHSTGSARGHPDETSDKTTSGNKTCNLFKCSSGECLSWSRICDGLYDCSSHDDERDCHK